MRITVVRTSAELVDIADYQPVTGQAATGQRVSDRLDVTVVRSSRNRTGGGARARPARALG